MSNNRASKKPTNSGQESQDKPQSGNLVGKILIALTAASVIGFAYYQYGDSLTLQNAAKYESAVREYKQQHPVLIFVAAFTIYVGVTGASLPGAVVLSLLYGWYFDFLPAFVLVSFASTTGATIAFLLSRYLFRDFVQRKFGERLNAFNENLRREGAFYLFTLRLIVAVPFLVINVVMGLTPIRVRTFWWVSQLEMLPGTAV